MGEPEFDVAEQFALQLPLNVISELLNIPHSMRDEIHELADQTLARSDDPSLAEKQMLAQIRIFEIFHGLVVERENNPRDDIISVIMNTEVDNDDEGLTTRKLDAAEVAIRFQEIAFAGHETVAKGIPNGTIAFTTFPGSAPAARVRPVAVGCDRGRGAALRRARRSCRAGWRSKTSRCTA